MGIRARTARVTISLVIAVGTVFAVSQSPAEADPEVCGYVRYGTDDSEPTSTVPYLTYCAIPCGSSIFVGIPPGHQGDLSWEAFVCVRGI